MRIPLFFTVCLFSCQPSATGESITDTAFTPDTDSIDLWLDDSSTETQTSDSGTEKTPLWTLPGKVIVDATFQIFEDGATHVISAAVPQDADWMAIRVTDAAAASDSEYCFSLGEVTDAADIVYVSNATSRDDWGQVCGNCTQRVSVGKGYGWFVFPNQGDVLPFHRTLNFRAAIRDCATLLPARATMGDALPEAVRVEVIWGNSVAESSRQLNLLVWNWQISVLQQAGSERLYEIINAAAEALRPFKIVLDLQYIPLSAPMDNTVAYTTDSNRPLDDLYRTYMKNINGEMKAAIPVFFVPCLAQTDALTGKISYPLATTIRIPGGGQTGVHADGIFLSTGNCHGKTVSPLWETPGIPGRILAHELGHYLGLYHSVEADNSEDLLSDTNAHNLMYYLPAIESAAGISTLQSAVMKNHPSIIDAVTNKMQH